MNKLTQKYLSMREKEKQDLLRIFSRMNEKQRSEIISLKISIFRTTKESFIEERFKHEEHDQACLVLAISKMLSDIKSLERKGSLDEKSLTRIEKFKKAAAKRQPNRKAPTSDYIKNNLIPEIEQLREEGFSWREIQNFVRKNHKKKISHTLLREVYVSTEEPVENHCPRNPLTPT